MGPITVLINYGYFDPGFLFRHPGCAVEVAGYLNKSWEIYQAYCKRYTAPRNDPTMTCRDLLWMFKVQQTVAQQRSLCTQTAASSRIEF